MSRDVANPLIYHYQTWQQTVLELKALSKTYKTGDRALTDVSFSVPAGQVVGLIGPSGAGKSSLIRCINRLVEPSSGNIYLGETELTKLNGRALRQARRRIGMIFQEYALVERLTVMENVLSGRLGYVTGWRSFLRRYPQTDIDQAFSFLERVGLGDHYNKRADELSGGQRQRVGIARALEQNPELLLADEPTASLDPKTSRQIMRLIQSVCREMNLPAIINIHDVVLAQNFADRIIGLQAGQVVFDGPASALTHDALTRIYGAEDWDQVQQSNEPQDDEALFSNAKVLEKS
ncbi:phosphonate ABC transporter ATP-binding protein [Marinobacter sp.]|uniref:phosphonate ABC transporter ATP-binding protein n=1 Tax=Marinobacter sp. TaxID=50741 RepID=UPI002B26DE28|nr:phosphonate ABC transporter ATP-binding protein [Marinobacter sp.]